MVAATAASGRQFELRHGDQRAVVVEVGAGLRSYTRAGRQLLAGYGPGELATFARGQTLIPWPNRLRGGAYTFDGSAFQLPIDEPQRGNAIHGLVRWANWSGTQDDPAGVRLSHVLYPREGYPFKLGLTLSYTLGAHGLSVETAATNLGERRCPYGAGAHPYLAAAGDARTIDRCELRAPGAIRLEVDEQMIPVGAATVDGSEYDFRSGRAIGATQLDTAFTDLARDTRGLAHVRLRAPDGTTEISVWQDPSYAYLMLFTADTLPDRSRRRHAVGVEPMTCAPNAFQSGDGLISLAPGETLTSRWGITC